MIFWANFSLEYYCTWWMNEFFQNIQFKVGNGLAVKLGKLSFPFEASFSTFSTRRGRKICWLLTLHFCKYYLYYDVIYTIYYNIRYMIVVVYSCNLQHNTLFFLALEDGQMISAALFEHWQLVGASVRWLNRWWLNPWWLNH